jgi:hypothetical protein
MNEHVRVGAHGAIIYKEHINTRPKPEAPQKPRKPLGLAPVPDEIVALSALDNVPADVLGSPATIGDVLEALDAAVSIRSDAETPLRVRLARLESADGELRTELAAARAAIETLQAAHDKTEAMVKAMRLSRPNKTEMQTQVKADVKAEVRAQLADMHAKRIARRAEQKAAKP